MRYDARMQPPLPADDRALPQAFFSRDTRTVARDLLGCMLVSRKDGVIAGGRIVETEAYLGADDAGSHAATKGITARNTVMYGPPGHLYVYFTYGAHHMLNLVCEPEGVAGAVLVRAMEPLWGVEAMERRRGGRRVHELADGPGKLTAALGLNLGDNGVPLNVGRVFVYDAPRPAAQEVAVSGRVGLTDGHEHPYRYYLRDSRFVSRGRTGPARKARSDRRGE